MACIIDSMPKRRRGRVLLGAAAALFATLGACVSAPQYDATTDANLSALQREIDAQLVKWIADVRSSKSADKENATYAKNVDFYNKVDTDMLSLELRMEAVPDASNKNLPQYFSNLRQIVENIKSTQQEDDAKKPPEYFDPDVLQHTRWQIAAQFAPLITYELTLKGVASPKESATSSAATKTASAKKSAGAVAPPIEK